MFGGSKAPQNEKTNFVPKSPYGAAKLYAHWITKIYRVLSVICMWNSF